jgi:hypothetical protein
MDGCYMNNVIKCQFKLVFHQSNIYFMIMCFHQLVEKHINCWSSRGLNIRKVMHVKLIEFYIEVTTWEEICILSYYPVLFLGYYNWIYPCLHLFRQSSCLVSITDCLKLSIAWKEKRYCIDVQGLTIPNKVLWHMPIILRLQQAFHYKSLEQFMG